MTKNPKIAFVMYSHPENGALRVFYAMTRAAGLEKEEFTLHYVHDRELSDEENGRDKERDSDALAQLGRSLTRLDPPVVVPLGADALFCFGGGTAISSSRGAVQQATAVTPGRKLVPSLEPGHVQKQWKWYAVVIGDFVKAKREAERGPDVIYPKRSLNLEPSIAEVLAFRDRCVPGTRIAADIETGWGFITCMGFSIGESDAISIPFVDKRFSDRNYWRTVGEELQAWEVVREILENPQIEKVGQNWCGYDAYWLLVKMGIRTYGLTEDTRLLHHALYPELPKDLAFMGASYTQQGPWKLMGYRGEKRDE